MKKGSLLVRLNQIVSGAFARVIGSLNSMIISFVIIRWQSPELWGEFVGYLLLLDFSFSIIAWGSTPFLIREFSFHPKNIKSEWNKSFYSRIPLLLIFFLIILFAPFPAAHKFILVIWAVLRFIYHAYESLIQYERNFIFSFMVEIVGLVIVLAPIALTPGIISIDTLLFLFVANMAWKAAATAFFFRSYLSFSLPDKNFYLEAFPFLLLTFSAMLQQRSDLFCVAYYLPEQETAKYQVFINLLIFSQFVSSLLLSPFAKNIFRLPEMSFNKLDKRFMLWGIPLSGISILAVYILMNAFYKLELSMWMYTLGYLYVLLFYLYLLKNYQLGKIRQQTRVAIYSFVASAVNILLSVLLTPILHLEGALLAGVSAQIVLVILYRHPYFITNAAR